MSYMEAYKFWLTDAYFDEDTKKELEAIAQDEKEIEDRFYRELEFGTGGLRGVIGAGTNRMNIYTVRKATQGLANYILKQQTSERVLRSRTTPVSCLPNFAKKQPFAWLQTASRPMYLMHFALHRNCLSRYANWAVQPAL